MAKSKFDQSQSQPEPSPLDNSHEIATDIVQAISHELHIRVGIGPIWRQLNSARKEEIINAWVHRTEEILKSSPITK